MKTVLFTTLALTASFTAVAADQPPPRPVMPMMATFADFDADKDGHITEQEFIDARNKRIAERASEGRPMRGLSQAEEFKDIDTNQDGSISPEEFAAHQNRHVQSRPRYPAR